VDLELIWDANVGTELVVHRRRVRKIALFPTSYTLATVEEDDPFTVRVWNTFLAMSCKF
jgi:hypothetical protein